MQTAIWFSQYKILRQNTRNLLPFDTIQKIHRLYQSSDMVPIDDTEIVKLLKIANITVSEIGLGAAAVSAILLYPIAKEKPELFGQNVQGGFPKEVYTILQGLVKVKQIYAKSSIVKTENFRKLLMSLAQDVRVIFIMIAERLYLMRHFGELNQEESLSIASETAYLYAPLAHRMGLYKIKTELEDLSMKYTFPDIYKTIARQLQDTKAKRDKYISDFITPLEAKLTALGLKFTIKGRTKSIFSIWNKLKKQNTTFDKIYDLFAIRVILDSPLDKEKADCWQVYSVVADMYQPNPKRLRDWLSHPKTNGYESLHTTVLGPEDKWVEVQIRTTRMDEIAEKGLAAHWRYKGIEGEKKMDQWLTSLREVLENPDLDSLESMDEFKLNLYSEEVFVFTPKGDLFKLPKGATLLDFAFAVHTQVGCRCQGGIVNGKHVTLKYVLENGDKIEIVTSSTQEPRADWINIATTSKARTKIRQVIKETETKKANNGRETLLRRFKNWKIEPSEARLSKMVKKMGYKTISDFYIAIDNEAINLLDIKEYYVDFDKKEETEAKEDSKQIVEEKLNKPHIQDDILIINNETKGVMYSMAKCCHPMFGDDIFGFVSVSSGIKIHRKDCPNAPQMMARFGYRVVQARWEDDSVKDNIHSLYITLEDDLSITSNINSIIKKENSIVLRSISFSKVNNMLEGRLTLTSANKQAVDSVIGKIKTIKGIITVNRI